VIQVVDRGGDGLLKSALTTSPFKCDDSPVVQMSLEEVRRVVEAAFSKLGVPADIRLEVAAHCVDAEASGVPSHGLLQVPRYVSDVESGEIVADARPRVVSDQGAAVLVSGEWGFGHVGMRFATDIAVERAAIHGVALVGLIASHHNGRLGAFVEYAAARDTALLCMSGGQGRLLPGAAPYSGCEPLFQSNPMAIGFPGSDGAAMAADFATSTFAGGRISLYHQAGKQLPPDAIVAADGSPTTDPGVFVEGKAWHLPFGGHKGYALMVACDLLGSVLTGAWNKSPGAEGGLYRRAGVFLLGVNAGVFKDGETVAGAASDLAAEIRASRPRQGFDRVMVPGDPEAHSRRKAEAEGISIGEELWTTLVALS
jgi:LDH2 family malate/lactate/ureidoglycolate dehydrogenase